MRVKALLYGLLSLLLLLLLASIVNQKNWRPLKGKENWRVRSNYSNRSAKKAIDSNRKTSWNSYAPIANGLFFEVDIHTPKRLNGISLEIDKSDKRGTHPVHWTLKTSLNGKDWQTVSPSKQITHRSMFVIGFPATEARYIQIINIYPESRIRWSISNLELLQPIVPWQLATETLPTLIVGVLCLILFVLLMRRSFFKDCRKSLLLSALLLLILLAAWGMRIYNLSAYELSMQEFHLLPFLQAEETNLREWLTVSLGDGSLGRPWLGLLLIRWVYLSFEHLNVSIRFITAIFHCVGLACLLFLGFKAAGLDSLQRIQVQARFWESFGVGAFLSLGSYPILLSRHGGLATSSFFVILLFLLFSYRFLYAQTGYAWLFVLACLFVFGFFLDPFLVVAPVGVLLFWLLRWLALSAISVCKNRPASSECKYVRCLCYGVSLLPLYLFLAVMLRSQKEGEILIWEASSPGQLWREFLYALHSSGVPDAFLWFLAVAGCLGLLKVLIEKRREEFFVLFMSGFLIVSGIRLSFVDISSPVLLMLGVFFWLSVKGGVFAFSYAAKKIGDAMLLYLFALTGLAFAGYLFIFSANSLFWGRTSLPLSLKLFTQYQQEKQLSALHQQILDNPDACKEVVVIDPSLAEMYSSEYPELNAQLLTIDELQRMSALARSKEYVLAPIGLPTNTKQYLEMRYDEIGKSSRIILYGLKDAEDGERTRYIWKDLRNSVGRHAEDSSSASGIVTQASPRDRAGYLSFAPHYPVCRSGSYIAGFIIRSGGAAPDEVLVSLKVNADSYDTVAHRSLRGEDFPSQEKYYRFDLPFELDVEENPAFPMKRLQFLVEVFGNATVRLDYIELLYRD